MLRYFLVDTPFRNYVVLRYGVCNEHGLMAHTSVMIACCVQYCNYIKSC